MVWRSGAGRPKLGKLLTRFLFWVRSREGGKTLNRQCKLLRLVRRELRERVKTTKKRVKFFN